MKIKINFERPYFDADTILALTTNDLDCFYSDENEVNRLNLFFVLENWTYSLYWKIGHNKSRKMILSRTRHSESQYEGIRILDVADWLLE